MTDEILERAKDLKLKIETMQRQVSGLQSIEKITFYGRFDEVLFVLCESHMMSDFKKGLYTETKNRILCHNENKLKKLIKEYEEL